MKKILSAVAALGLIAGVATSASALEFSVSGEYFVEGVHLGGADYEGLVLGHDDSYDEEGSINYWRHEFVIKPVMKVNDKITVKSKIYLAGGYNLASGGTSKHKGGYSGSGSNGDGRWADTGSDGEIRVHHIYMEYMSPIGKVRVGRTSAGLWMGDFLSSDLNANRIMYFPNFMPENMGACIFTQKIVEEDADNGTADEDYDLYEAGVWYKTKDLMIAGAYDFFRNATNSSSTLSHHRLKGYYNQQFDSVYAEVEFAYDFGDWDNDGVSNPFGGGDNLEEMDAFAIMADVGMKMGKLDIGTMFIYASGDDDPDDDTVNAAMHSLVIGGNGGLGEQFQPLNILTGAHTGLLVSDVQDSYGKMDNMGVVALLIHADFAVSETLTLHSALGYAQAESEYDDYDDEYGWEIDLGVAYKLMDNLTYQVDFGYLVTGDYFEYASTSRDTEDVYTLTHKLTMEF